MSDYGQDNLVALVMTPAEANAWVWHVAAYHAKVSQRWRDVLLADPCVYCGGTAEDLDHIRARSHDGPDGWENRAPTCAACNKGKAQRHLLRYLWYRRMDTLGRVQVRAVAHRAGQPVKWMTVYPDSKFWCEEALG